MGLAGLEIIKYRSVSFTWSQLGREDLQAPNNQYRAPKKKKKKKNSNIVPCCTLR
jgi:hypothetical protein